MTTTDWTGFTGVTILLIAYCLLLLNKVTKDDPLYISLNLGGAGLALIAAILLPYLPFIILEAAWTIVSIYSLIAHIRNRWQVRKTGSLAK
jgi:hypothetical protein